MNRGQVLWVQGLPPLCQRTLDLLHLLTVCATRLIGELPHREGLYCSSQGLDQSAKKACLREMQMSTASESQWCSL